MHWWQNALSSPSSSSPSSEKSTSSDSNLLESLNNNHRSSIFSFAGRGFGFGFGFRSEQRRFSRARKLQHLDYNHPRPFSNDAPSPRGSTVAPQPLPLPELAVLLRQDAAHALPPSNSTANVRLPSPKAKEGPSPSKCRGGEEREKSDALRRDAHNGDTVTSSASKLACQDARRSSEHTEIQASRRSPNRQYGAEKSPNNYMLNVPISVPGSPFASPALSPRRSNCELFTSNYVCPPTFQVWSAPEMPQSEFNVDNSTLHCPRPSFSHNAMSPSGPVSPLHTRLSTDSPVVRRENNAQTNVHPLPLPPVATMPSLPAASPEVKTIKGRMKSRWKKGKLIGRGTFGSVYVGSNRETGALCAMKEVELLPDDPKASECIRQLEQEIKVLSQLQHPNIVQYYGSEIVGDRFYIYLEYVHPGSIVKYIRDHCGAITESVVRNFTRHILSGLAYLHGTKTIHRDIKGANLLVDAYGVVKLADFGMAKHLTGQTADLSLKGSPYWMAPELLQSMVEKDADPDLALAVDIWSLGCTIIEMMNGKPPWSEYEGPAAMFKVLKETPPIPETLSPEGKDFLHCCLQRNPAERPSASMLLEHRFLKNSHQQLDITSFTQALNGITLTEKTHHQADRPIFTGTQSTKGKVSNSETGQKSCAENPESTVAPGYSPCSALEALLTLSPLRLGPSIGHPPTSATFASSIKQVVRNNPSQ